MKLALLGSSAIALEAALRFHEHEAAWTWFNGEEEEIETLFRSVHISWEDCTSDLGRKYLTSAGGKSFEWGSFSWEKWKNYYYLPLVEFLKTQQSVKPYQVLSVSKRFLAPSEEIQGKSRFHDLFRVMYQLNPEEFINQQKDVNPETYQRLSEEFMESLQSSLEMYEDFDLFLDLRRPIVPSSVSVTGKALGESRIGKEHIFAGARALHYIPASGASEIALIGSDDVAAEVMIRLGEWLRDPRTRLFIVSAEEDPFKDFLQKARPEVSEKLLEVFSFLETEFEAEKNDFHKKLREWQELDEYIQVKKTRPVEPVSRLVFFSGHNVTAVDQLIDRRRLFVTLEKPEWREGLRQPENNHLDLKTIGVDEIIVATGLKKKPVNEDLRDDEVGYLTHSPFRPSYKNAWKEDLNALESIEKKIFKLFSPAGTL